jgi:hypothetical protein
MIKVLTTIGQVFTPENLKKLKDAKELISEWASELFGNGATLCEMYQLEKLDMEGLKKIIMETQKENSAHVALLNLGRNQDDELEVFLQHLDVEKNPLNSEKVYCIRCEMISKEIKESFGDKELLLVKL